VTARAGRTVWLAVLAAWMLRLAFGFGYWVDKPLTHDEREYLALGVNLAEGRGFTYPPQPEGEPAPERFGRAPLYPLFLAGLAAATGPLDSLVAVKIAQAALGAFGVWFIALTAARIAGPQAAGLAAWAAALYPPLVWIPAYVLSETLYMALAFANVVIASVVIDEPRSHAPTFSPSDAPTLPRSSSPSALLLCGVLGGLAALTRPAHLFFLLFLGIWMLLRRRVRDVSVVAVGALLVIVPWTARNYREHGRPVLIASEGGITFWTGNHPLARGEGDMAANPAIKLDNRRLRSEHPGLEPEALEPIYYREAFDVIGRNPLWWLSLLARKAFYTIVPVGPSYTLHSTRYLVASVLSYGAVLVCAVAGSVALARRRRFPVALGLLLGSAGLVCVVFFPQERFRIPVIDPTLIVLGAAGFVLSRSRPAALAAPADALESNAPA
jgi:hypothetical protein